MSIKSKIARINVQSVIRPILVSVSKGLINLLTRNYGLGKFLED